MVFSALRRFRYRVFCLPAMGCQGEKVPGGGIEPALGQAQRDFEGEKGGWRKPLITIQNLRQPLNFTEKVDND